MEKFIVNGGKKLSGQIQVSGSKNMALKALVAACLTDEEVVIDNIPLISDLFVMTDIIQDLGGKIDAKDHTIYVKLEKFKTNTVALERAAEVRTSALFMAPLLTRAGKAIIPNPGGCRIGARPIDRTIEGLRKMGVDVSYHSDDGFFHMNAPKGLKGVEYTFKKSTHTGTETLILAAVLAKGKTVLRNAAQEPEIDELIILLNQMGAKIKRKEGRVIEIEGVRKLSGTRFKVGPDRNEAVTFAVGAIITKGDILVKGLKEEDVSVFLNKMKEAGAGVDKKDDGIRFFYKGEIKATSMETSIYPGFMTDWQAPWAVLMTQAKGTSIIHERVYESRFSYVLELQKMGADIELFNPKVVSPGEFYEFNIKDDEPQNKHAIRIEGPTRLHNGILTMMDLRAGATLVLAALAAQRKSVILEVHHLDRGYERFEHRLNSLGADIIRVADE